jgi:hypothetical protein
MLSAAALFSDHVSAGPWSVVRSPALMPLFRTPSNHTLSGRRPRVALIVGSPRSGVSLPRSGVSLPLGLGSAFVFIFSLDPPTLRDGC